MAKEYNKTLTKSILFTKLDRDTLSAESVKAMLPRVGQKLLRKPTIHVRDIKENAGTIPCVVTYVNRKHLWYEVEFETLNGKKFRESYKLPVSTAPSDGGPAGGIFV